MVTLIKKLTAQMVSRLGDFKHFVYKKRLFPK